MDPLFLGAEFFGTTSKVKQKAQVGMMDVAGPVAAQRLTNPLSKNKHPSETDRQTDRERERD